MKKHDDFERSLLSRVPAGISPHGSHISIYPPVEANDFQLPVEHICQLMAGMYRGGLILLHVFDGLRECSLQEWLALGRKEDEFFHCKANNYQVKVRLTAVGAEANDVVQKPQIGFSAHQ